MKLTYHKPEVEIIEMGFDSIIMAGSDRSTKGEAFDSGVGPSVGNGDDYSHDNGSGQGEGGTGNRANTGLWDTF